MDAYMQKGLNCQTQGFSVCTTMILYRIKYLGVLFTGKFQETITHTDILKYRLVCLMSRYTSSIRQN